MKKTNALPLTIALSAASLAVTLAPLSAHAGVAERGLLAQNTSPSRSAAADAEGAAEGAEADRSKFNEPSVIMTSDGAPSIGTEGATTAAANKPITDDDVTKRDKTTRWVDRFAGSQFFVQASSNLNVFAPGLQQSRNGTADSWLALSPRFSLSKTVQLRARFNASYEFTNSDSTTKNHEFRFGDANVQMFYRGLPALPGGIKANPFVQTTLPVSPESQARTMYFSPGAGLQLARVFEHVLHGNLMLLGSANYTRPVYKYTTAGVTTDMPYAPSCAGNDSTSCVTQLSGAANPRDIFAWTVLVAGTWGKFSPGAFFWMTHVVPYQFSDSAVSTISGDIPVGRLSDRTALRQSSYFSVWLDYEINDWLTPEVGYQMSRSVLSGSGSYGNPLASRYEDMRVYVGLNFGLDSLYKSVVGRSGQAGIQRAHSGHGPALQF